MPGSRASARGRRIVERQIEHLLELDDVVDLGPHRDVGDAFENELDDDRHAVLRHQFARRRKRRLRVLRIGDADRLAAKALGDRDMIDAVDAELGRVDVLERELDVIVHVEAALRLADQPEIGIVHDDVDVGQLELRADRELLDQELEIVVARQRDDLARSGSAARTPSAAGNVHPSGPACPALIQLRGR